MKSSPRVTARVVQTASGPATVYRVGRLVYDSIEALEAAYNLR